MTEKNKIRPSATVVLIRENQGLEVLLARRNPQLRFLGDYWVFPGGALDDADQGEHLHQRVLQAGLRELEEEVGLCLQADQLQAFAHWITPDIYPKRFSTWFYLAAVSKMQALQVQVDGSELLEQVWLRPAEAIAEHKQGRAKMLPPTLITLCRLAHCQTVADAKSQLAVPFNAIQTIEPVVQEQDGRLNMLYPGDLAYPLSAGESLDVAPGYRHRCVEVDGVWCYENTAEGLSV